MGGRFDLSVNNYPLFFAQVIELGSDGLGEGYEGAVVFALLGGGVWSLDSHGLKCLGLVWNQVAELIQGSKRHPRMDMRYPFIQVDGQVKQMQILSPSDSQIVYQLKSGPHEFVLSLLGVYFCVTATQLDNGLQRSGATAVVNIGHGLASFGVTILGVSVIFGLLACSIQMLISGQFKSLGIKAPAAANLALVGKLEIYVLFGTVMVYVSLLGPGFGLGVVVGVVDLPACCGSSISDSCLHHCCHNNITSTII